MGHQPERVRPREHKRLDSQVRHFGHDLLQKDCEQIVPRGNTAIFSQKYEIRLALRILANVASPKPVLMIICGPPARVLVTCAPLPLMLGFIEKSFVRRPLRYSVTRYCRKPGFHGSHMRYCLARLIRSFKFTSIRPPLGYAQTATSSVFTDSVPDDYATEEVLLAHIKRVDAPSCLSKAPI